MIPHRFYENELDKFTKDKTTGKKKLRVQELGNLRSFPVNGHDPKSQVMQRQWDTLYNTAMNLPRKFYENELDKFTKDKTTGKKKLRVQELGNLRSLDVKCLKEQVKVHACIVMINLMEPGQWS
eukprot:sb/3475710/